MKMTKILSLVLALVMCAGILCACPLTPGTTTTTEKPGPEANPLAGTYDIKMWMSELDGVAELTQKQIDAFEAANPGIVINAEISGVTEADAGSQVLNDVASAPDIYCFAQDQLARLVQGSALAAPSDEVAALLKTLNDGGSYSAGSIAGKLYAYPMTSDNGYYMYYDTSIITNPDSLEQIIADVEAYNAAHPGAEKKIRYALENGWYTASFFFATGCASVWYTDESGNWTSCEDNYNSPEGIIAMRGMEKLAKSTAYDSNSDILTDAAVIVTGIWKANDAADHFGENLGATDLPSFEVDGKSYHLGSFSGNKLMGVKPQTDTKRAAVLKLLAMWLTNEQSQLERFDLLQWGPSNLNAQGNEKVQANVSLAALAKQGAYAHAEANIAGAWWDLAKVLGADAKAAKSVEDLQAALDVYEAGVKAALGMTEEQRQAWSVIGSICGTTWNTDFSMTKVDENVYESSVLALKQGDEFKCRQGGSWDLNIGADGNHNGPNVVVAETGNYVVRLTITGEKTGTIELIPQ